MRNIANDGTYKFTQGGPGGQPVGYLVVTSGAQHWVLGRAYAPPGEANPLVELRFTQLDTAAYSEAKVAELHRGLPGSHYVAVGVSTPGQAGAPPAGAGAKAAASAGAGAGVKAAVAGAGAKAAGAGAGAGAEAAVARVGALGGGSVVARAGKKQIDLGCFMIYQDSAERRPAIKGGEAYAGRVCVRQSGHATVENWLLASAAGEGVVAYRPIGAEPVSLFFKWLDGGQGDRPLDEHRAADEALERAGAARLVGLCHDRGEAPPA